MNKVLKHYIIYFRDHQIPMPSRKRTSWKELPSPTVKLYIDFITLLVLFTGGENKEKKSQNISVLLFVL